jgi:hypothetical protein
MEGAPHNDEAIRAELKALLLEAYSSPHFEDVHDKIVDKAEDLQRKYPDYADYELYHLMIGSTTENSGKFDFPAGDSVEEFIRSL